MAHLRYLVNVLSSGKFLVTAQRYGQLNRLRLYTPQCFGPLTDFMSTKQHWLAGRAGESLSPCLAHCSGDCVELPPSCDSFSYLVDLGGDKTDGLQLFRGCIRPEFRCFFGHSLFLAAEDVERYEIEFSQQTYSVSVRQGEKRQFVCATAAELFAAQYVQGAFQLWQLKDQPVVLIGPTDDSTYIEPVVQFAPVLLSACRQWFGPKIPYSALQIIVWHDASLTQGIGIASAGCCCLILPTYQANDSSIAWLVLHELLHQWIGIAVRGKDSSLDWFFEGFVMYLTNRLLIECRLDDRQKMQTAINASVDASHTQNRLQDYHTGMLLMYTFAGRLARDRKLSLQKWLQRFYTKWQGMKIGRQELVDLLLQAAPEQEGDHWLTDYLTEQRIFSVTAAEIMERLYKESANQTDENFSDRQE